MFFGYGFLSIKLGSSSLFFYAFFIYFAWGIQLFGSEISVSLQFESTYS